VAEQQNSHSLLAETHLLQSKLALLEFDIKNAQRHLTLAQSIADERGLSRLALKISNDHDSLLLQLSNWEELIERDVPLVDRVELAHLEEFMVRILRNRVTERTEISKEEPISVMILNKTGICLFSKKFDRSIVIDEQLMSGVLSAINRFSSDLFSGSLDRIKVGEYTLLVRSEESLLSCYVFKGQSYKATQKLSRFMRYLKNNEAIWNCIKEEPEGGKLVVMNNIVLSALEKIVLEIFIN
ncbi:MAG: hypothetical protein ACFFD4_32980, partial [Candidatus Odinarchaeota archaeon]